MSEDEILQEAENIILRRAKDKAEVENTSGVFYQERINYEKETQEYENRLKNYRKMAYEMHKNDFPVSYDGYLYIEHVENGSGYNSYTTKFVDLIGVHLGEILEGLLGTYDDVKVRVTFELLNPGENDD